MSPPIDRILLDFRLETLENSFSFLRKFVAGKENHARRHEDPPPPFFDGQHRIVGIISQFFCCLRHRRRLDPLSVLYVQNTIIDAPFSQECVCPLFSISFIPKNCWKMRKWSRSEGANPSRALAKFLPSRSLKEHVETEDPATSGGIKEARP